ncbi:phosphonate ABC transporter, permease protein PhnE [Ideonella paludis]|uniref:phosphonate ABC transporter, permease protein PhnE n=1 Tax=Ideonella paludis TaxID=1233411 RepID=UPI0028733D10|nr:phosphonate ABC transporter, permease protein PhnE [Ideonella paludis]
MRPLRAAFQAWGWPVAALALVVISAWTLAQEGELGWGRKPWQNLQATVSELAQPSWLKLWFGDPARELRNEEGELLRVINEPQAEARYLAGVGRALWTTLRMATLGTVAAMLLALPLALLAARNLGAPAPLRWGAKAVLDTLRAVHTLVFGLFLVGIVGLGATAGILAIALHSAGSLGKLWAEAIEALDMAPIDAVRATGARPAQVFFLGVWPAVLPQGLSQTLYVWEFNLRDSTILGLVGAGGLGLLVSESISLFQWGRLATLLMAIVLLVTLVDATSRRLRQRLL